jgi:hypothetical protein
MREKKVARFRRILPVEVQASPVEIRFVEFIDSSSLETREKRRISGRFFQCVGFKVHVRRHPRPRNLLGEARNQSVSIIGGEGAGNNLTKGR